MSCVDNVVLLMSYEEARGKSGGTAVLPALDRLNAWLASREFGKLHLVDEYGTNRKAMECCVAIGAFNYLDREGFFQAFREAGWEDPDSAQLMFMGQDDDVFSEHRVTVSAEDGQ